MKRILLASILVFTLPSRAQEIDVYEKYDFYDIDLLAENFHAFRERGSIQSANCFYGGQLMLDDSNIFEKNAGFEFFEFTYAYLKNFAYPLQFDAKLVSSKNSFDLVNTQAIVQGSDTSIVHTLSTNTLKYFKLKARAISYLPRRFGFPKIFLNSTTILDEVFAYDFNTTTLGFNISPFRNKNGTELNILAAFTATEWFHTNIAEFVLSGKMPVLKSGSNFALSLKYSKEFTKSDTRNIPDPKQALDYFLNQVTFEFVVPNHTSSINFMASNYLYRANLNDYRNSGTWWLAYSLGAYLNIPFFLVL